MMPGSETRRRVLAVVLGPALCLAACTPAEVPAPETEWPETSLAERRPDYRLPPAELLPRAERDAGDADAVGQIQDYGPGQGQVLLRIVTEPPGARIFLDGTEAFAVTPIELALESGRTHAIRFVLDGHETLEAIIDPGAPPEDGVLTYTLRPLGARS